MEAVYAGVPLVAVPLFGDQFHNVANYVQEGVAVKLDYPTINKENVLSALKAVLDNPSYTERAKSVSVAFKDRPMTPLQTAVFWTEYVIRHNGASHLKSIAADLPLYQYLLLDVVAFLFIVLAIVFFILKRMFSVLVSCFHSSKVKHD
ncbi:hypothetical protein C0J52_02523 [Blattella germanica]|nr:hypothetical protein C0J52_02523 [Blattella germanica]